jgi:REP element-mobilizing transposase RayT
MPKFDPRIHHRHSIRLKGYDYSRAGAYFVTIDIHNHEPMLGEILEGAMRLSHSGQIVQRAWFDLPKHYHHVELDAFCIMPNHVHGIIMLNDVGSVGAGLPGLPDQIGDNAAANSEASRYAARPAPTRPAQRYPLSEIIRAFKTYSARRINAARSLKGIPVWQRNYYEHIIRNDREYEAIRKYILDNPRNWEKDQQFTNQPGAKI